MSRVVLVTGVSRDLAARFARSLAMAGDDEVLGIDVTPPRHELGAVEFVRADLRSPMLARVIERRGVDTVVHLAVSDEGANRASVKEANVIGTMQLLAACQKAPGFRKLVVLSSGEVYGSAPLDPAMFTESMAVRHPPASGYGHDLVEVEAYARAFAARRPEVTVTVLRLAELMGGQIETSLIRYLELPVIWKPMGYDARLQFLHPADAVTAFLAAVREDIPGVFNVAAPDVVTLNQVVRTLGRVAVSVPPQPQLLTSLSRRAHLPRFDADALRGLTWGRAIDSSRFTEAVGFSPHYSSRRALEEYAALSRQGPLSVERFDKVIDTAAQMLIAGRKGDDE